MSVINPNCDGDKCKSPNDPVRIYPLGGGANLHYCVQCFAAENLYRISRGGEKRGFPVVNWKTAERYKCD